MCKRCQQETFKFVIHVGRYKDIRNKTFNKDITLHTQDSLQMFITSQKLAGHAQDAYVFNLHKFAYLAKLLGNVIYLKIQTLNAMNVNNGWELSALS